MAMIFPKHLTTTDIDSRLRIPTKAVDHINMPEGENNVSVTCRYVSDGTVWTFRCYKRPYGHPKPVFTTGWLEFARAKGLRIDDKVIFGMQEDEAGGGGAAQHTIQARRAITLMGNPTMADL